MAQLPGWMRVWLRAVGPEFSNRRLTRDSQVPVVSLEIPGIVVSLVNPVFPIFARKNSGKIVKICFSNSRDQNKILKFSCFFYMPGISFINPYFRAPRPLKPLKSNPRYQNLRGDPLIAHSGHRKPLSARSRPLAFRFLTKVSLISLSWLF